jgi:hypothetical protein
MSHGQAYAVSCPDGRAPDVAPPRRARVSATYAGWDVRTGLVRLTAQAVELP